MPQSKCGALPLGYGAFNNQTKVVEGHGFEPWNPKEQIYSLPRLTTSLSLQKKDGGKLKRMAETASGFEPLKNHLDEWISNKIKEVTDKM